MERIIIIDDSKIKSELDNFLLSKKDFVQYDNQLDHFLMKAQILFEDIQELDQQVQKIVIKTESRHYILKISSIIRIAENGEHSMLFLEDDATIHSSNKLDWFENKLKDHHFCRINSGQIINLKYITRLDLKEEPRVVVNNKLHITVDPAKLGFIKAYIDLIQLNP